MNPLPQAYITWDESAVDLTSFLRYQVYRREFGDTAWTKIQRINERGRTYHSDFEQWPGITYEYSVTQVVSVGGDEIESAFSDPIQSSIDTQNLFIHLRNNPGVYAELEVMDLDDGQSPDIVFQQPRASQWPTAYVGLARPRAATFEADAAWPDKRAIEDAALALLAGQGAAGGVVARWYASPGLYGVLTAFSQRLAAGGVGWHIEVAEIKPPEAVQ